MIKPRSTTLRRYSEDAETYVFMAATDRGGASKVFPPWTGWSYKIVDQNEAHIEFDYNKTMVNGRHHEAFLPMMLSVAERCSEVSLIHMVCSQKHIVERLALGIEGRQSARYKSVSGKAYDDINRWHELDDLIRKRNQIITASLPAPNCHLFHAVKEMADVAADSVSRSSSA